jgi:ornithine decarboxylase
MLKRTGFQLPVFIFSQEPTDVPDGATAVISGKAQEFLELETLPAVTKRICCRRFSTP